MDVRKAASAAALSISIAVLGIYLIGDLKVSVGIFLMIFANNISQGFER